MRPSSLRPRPASLGGEAPMSTGAGEMPPAKGERADPASAGGSLGGGRAASGPGLLTALGLSHHDQSDINEAALHMINFVVGGSVLALPRIFSSCGLLLGAALLGACAAATYGSLRLLLVCAARTGATRYEQAMGIGFGAAGRRIAELWLVLLHMGCLVGSLNILADVVSPLANAVVPPGAEPSRGVIMAGVAAVGLLPLSLASTAPRDTAGTSLAGVGFVLLFCVAIGGHLLLPLPPAAAAAASTALAAVPGAAAGAVAGTAGAASAGAASAASAAAVASLSLFRLGGVLKSVPVLCFAFTAHGSVFPAFETLPDPRRMESALRRATAGCFFIYLAAGALGYAAFRERTAGNVLRNFDGARLGTLPARGIKLAYGVAVMSGVPASLVPVRDALVSLVMPPPWRLHLAPGAVVTHGTGAAAAALAAAGAGIGAGAGGHAGGAAGLLHPSGLAIRVLTAVVLCATLACASMLPGVEFAFGITGATASMVLSYILPAGLFLRLTQGSSSSAEGGAGGGKDGLGAGFVDSGGGSGGDSGPSVGVAAKGSDAGKPAVARGSADGGTSAAEARRRQISDRHLAWALLLGGLLSAAVCTATTIMAVRTETKVVALAHRIVALEAGERAVNTRVEKVTAAMARMSAAEARSAASGLEVQRATEYLTTAQKQEAAALGALTGKLGAAGKGAVGGGSEAGGAGGASGTAGGPAVATLVAAANRTRSAVETIGMALEKLQHGGTGAAGGGSRKGGPNGTRGGTGGAGAVARAGTGGARAGGGRRPPPAKGQAAPTDPPAVNAESGEPGVRSSEADALSVGLGDTDLDDVSAASQTLAEAKTQAAGAVAAIKQAAESLQAGETGAVGGAAGGSGAGGGGVAAGATAADAKAAKAVRKAVKRAEAKAAQTLVAVEAAGKELSLAEQDERELRDAEATVEQTLREAAVVGGKGVAAGGGGGAGKAAPKEAAGADEQSAGATGGKGRERSPAPGASVARGSGGAGALRGSSSGPASAAGRGGPSPRPAGGESKAARAANLHAAGNATLSALLTDQQRSSSERTAIAGAASSEQLARAEEIAHSLRPADGSEPAPERKSKR